MILDVRSEADIARVAQLLVELRAQSVEESGCMRFEVYQSHTNSRVFMLIEQWNTQQDLDNHRLATAFTKVYIPMVLPLVERVPHDCRRLA